MTMLHNSVAKTLLRRDARRLGAPSSSARTLAAAAAAASSEGDGATTLRKTALHGFHLERGGDMVPFAVSKIRTRGIADVVGSIFQPVTSGAYNTNRKGLITKK